MSNNNIILKRLCIYRYTHNGNQPLGILLCNTAYDNIVVMVPLTPSPIDAHSVKLSTLNQYANTSSYIEISTKDITSPIYVKSQPARITQNEFEKIYAYVLEMQFQDIATSTHYKVTTLDLFEKTYQFLKWQLRKYDLYMSHSTGRFPIYENAIYWADLGINVGSELNKRRPVLIWKKRNNHKNIADSSFIIIPITSKQKKSKYYMNVPVTIGTKPCYLRVEDMRRINIKRIVGPVTDKTQQQQQRLIFIDNTTRESIKNAISKFYIFDNQYKDSNT